MTGLAGRLPVRIEKGAGGVRVFVDIGGLAEMGASVRADLEDLKASYVGAVKAAQGADAPAREGGRVSARRRWAACRILADFDRKASGKFEIVNYKEACARDLGVSLRSVRVYLDFAESFSDGEVLDEVPFSLYAELMFRVNELRRDGRLGPEKARLARMGRSGRLPTRDAYRRSLGRPSAGRSRARRAPGRGG